MRTSSRRPADREEITGLADSMGRVRDSLSVMHPAHSTMDYQQAQTLLDHALWLAGYAAATIEIRVKQSGKSAARSGRGLGQEAI